MESTVKGIWNAITDVLDDIVNAMFKSLRLIIDAAYAICNGITNFVELLKCKK